MTFREWWKDHSGWGGEMLAEGHLAEDAWNAAIAAASAELEAAFTEAETLNLLHGAARVRALSSNAKLRREP